MLVKALEIFLIFFKIGLFTFGGGYAMMPLINQDVVETGIISSSDFSKMIAISESTPGPFAINMATFAGFRAAGVLGSLMATLGVVMPSFFIIIIIAIVAKKFIKEKEVKRFFKALLILITGFILAAGTTALINILSEEYNGGFDYGALVIFTIITCATFLMKKPKPIFIILMSAFLGILVYY